MGRTRVSSWEAVTVNKIGIIAGPPSPPHPGCYQAETTPTSPAPRHCEWPWAPILTCSGLLHPPVWEGLVPAGLRRGRAPFDHPHVLIHRTLRGREQGRRTARSLGFPSRTPGL